MKKRPLFDENALINCVIISERRVFLGPDVMQSRFGVNFLFWPGEF